MKNNNCFYCLNSGEGIPAENNGWFHPCKLGINNEGMADVSTCPHHSENRGFQIGGYYTHMHFESDGSCLEWVIHGNGDFPITEEGGKSWLRFHICDFTQIEEWVKIWGVELRKRGLISDD